MFFGELCHHCAFPQVGIYEHVNIGHGFKYTRISPLHLTCVAYVSILIQHLQSQSFFELLVI